MAIFINLFLEILQEQSGVRKIQKVLHITCICTVKSTTVASCCQVQHLQGVPVNKHFTGLNNLIVLAILQMALIPKQLNLVGIKNYNLLSIQYAKKNKRGLIYETIWDHAGTYGTKWDQTKLYRTM